jgi:hypothetical protein
MIVKRCPIKTICIEELIKQSLPITIIVIDDSFIPGRYIAYHRYEA